MPTLPPLLFEASCEGQKAYSLAKSDPEFEKFLPNAHLIRKKSLRFPELSELAIVRHFNKLADCNMGIENGFYPLGSCTMKYNPKIHEYCASFPHFQKIHPFSDTKFVQGNLYVIDELIKMLCELTGMASGTLLPNAGAQGEFVALKMIKAFHLAKNEKRSEIIIPTHAHGTNPASATIAGYKVISVSLNQEGEIDLKHLAGLVSEKTAGIMLTNPSTLGLFNPYMKQISRMIHQAGGLVYYDGANFNAIVGLLKPIEMGFDLLHLNLHKTFSTPHGGGGPGSGPVLCSKELEPFLPLPKIFKEKQNYKIEWSLSESIGKIASFHGNFGVYFKAYMYIRLLGKFGLAKVAKHAILNANYLKNELEKVLKVPFQRRCMHEFVVQADQFLSQGIKASDIAKRLLDFDCYAPTVYFPLMVKEALLIEPTETESKETLDAFVNIIKIIIKEIEADPNLIKESPHTTPIHRLDQTLAARHPKISFFN